MLDIAVASYEIERNKPMPSLNHGVIQNALGSELRVRYKNRFTIASELSLALAEWPSVPDICIYSKRKIDLKNDVIAMTEPPLCAIEILSPTQSTNDLFAKAYKYFDFGVKSCWIVLPIVGNIYVFSSPDEYEIFRLNETLVDDVLDISLPLKEVFEEG